tara:strand:- start:2033 stop:5329 length:3297 start_codon:yes stop_codon:yes gene_type:complete
MSDTIIIECNRQIAVRDQLKTLSDGSYVNGVFSIQGEEDLPSHKWTTTIPSGIEVNVGDQISVEATMINTKGSPDSTIEFMGNKNSTNPADLVDNECDVYLGFYITNNQEFNFNMPNGYTQLYTDYTSIYYGTPDLSTYEKFNVAYPCKGLEGFKYIVADINKASGPWGPISWTVTGAVPPPPYEPVRYNTTFPNPPAPLYHMNNARLYYCEGFTWGQNGATFANIQQNKVTLNVDSGFNTPSSVANRLSGQLQGRIGDADNFINTLTPSPLYFGCYYGGVEGYNLEGAVSTPSYPIIPTSTGALFYARSKGEWSARFAWEGGNYVHNQMPIQTGTGYSEAQGQKIFWNNMLCGEPEVWTARTDCWANIRKEATMPETADLVNNDTAYKLNYYELCLADTLVYGFPGGQVQFPNLLNTTTNDPWVALVPPYQCIVSNIVYNDYTVEKVANLMKAMEYINKKNSPNDDDGFPDETLLPTDPRLDDYRVFDFAFGRSADGVVEVPGPNPPDSDTTYFTSCGGNSTHFNIPNPKDQQTKTNTSGNPAYYKYRATGDGNGYRYGVDIGNHAYGQKFQNQMNNGLKANYIRCMTRWSDAYNTDKIATPTFKCNLPFDVATYQSTTKFSFRNGLGATGDNSASIRNNVALVPVFYKEGSVPGGANITNIPMMAFVSNIKKNQKECLYPNLGESLGMFSISMYDNILAKPASTQKFGKQKFTDTTASYPDGIETVDYANNMYMGATNPTISFDDNGDGRFSAKGFHTDYKTGNGTFATSSDKSNPQSGQSSAVSRKLYSGFSSFLGREGDAKPPDYAGQDPKVPWITSQSGCSIISISVPKKDDSGSIFLNSFNPEIYKNTLFSKLGFDIEQLLPYSGNPSTVFNRDSYNKFLGINKSAYYKEQNLVRPFTTNGYISAFASIASSTNFENNPTENLGVMNNNFNQPSGNTDIASLELIKNDTVLIDCESDELVASGLPTKLDFAYLVLYSDIVGNSQFYGGANGHQKIPAMAYISRNYSAGDYFYSFTTNWTYTADKDYILTNIHTNITLPNGEPAPIEPNSSVIYKISKPKSMPPPPLPITHQHRPQRGDKDDKKDDNNPKHKQ